LNSSKPAIVLGVDEVQIALKTPPSFLAKLANLFDEHISIT
jgi:hypothetical protein